MPLRALVLGGTAEAARLARLLATTPAVAATYSLAGRTRAPAGVPLPTRIGGFGGVQGLVAYLDVHGIDAVIDATHPFAAQISANAAEACRRSGVPRLTLERAPWLPEPGDLWQSVPDTAAAVATLGQKPRRVFVTTGRLELAAYRDAPHHSYLIRAIDPPDPAVLPPRAMVLLARGPFSIEEEAAVMTAHGINTLVTKNSGAGETAAKLVAARQLGVPVIMVERPPGPGGPTVSGPAAAMTWLASLSAKRAPGRD